MYALNTWKKNEKGSVPSSVFPVPSCADNQSLGNVQTPLFQNPHEKELIPNNSDDVFTIHEGTKVSVLDEVDNWKKIKLADGKIGWLNANELKEL